VQKEKAPSPLEAELTTEWSPEGRMLQILGSLTDAERKALDSVFAKIEAKNSDPSMRSTRIYSYEWLAATLTKHGHPITKHQVRAYMKRTRKKTS